MVASLPLGGLADRALRHDPVPMVLPAQGFAALETGLAQRARDGQAFLKTLKGLQRIDVLLRRVEGRLADPLELAPDSTPGVAGLLDAMRAGGVRVVKDAGSHLAGAPALAAFLPALAARLGDAAVTLGLRQRIAALQEARHLETREPARAVGEDLLRRQIRRRRARLQYQAGLDLLAAIAVGHGDDGGFRDRVELEQHRLDLARGDVLARPADHVLHPADDDVEAVGVAAEQVARTEPAAVAEGLRGRLRLVPVAPEDAGAAHPELADRVGAERAPLLVADRGLAERRGQAATDKDAHRLLSERADQLKAKYGVGPSTAAAPAERVAVMPGHGEIAAMSQEDAKRNNLDVETRAGPMLELARLLPEFAEAETKVAVRAMTTKLKAEPSPAQALILENLINNLVSQGELDVDGQKLFTEALAALEAADKARQGGRS